MHMPIAYKILGQAVPATSSDIITVSAGHQEVVSSLLIANTTATASTFRIHARIAGAAVATSNALIYDSSVPAYSTTTFTIGITLAATDVLTVVAGTSGALTVTAFGSEIS
jgi:hypothetical protein